MPQYLLVAEKVFKNIQNNKYFMEEPVEDLNTLMIEIRKALVNTELKLIYKHIDFENLVLCNSRSKIQIDLTLIPKVTSHQEFILWLAGFIEKITDGPKRPLPPLAHNYELPKYALEDEAKGKTSSSEIELTEYFRKAKQDNDGNK